MAQPLEKIQTYVITQAIERIRDFLVSQIKALRSPNINAQIIQQRAFIAYKDLYFFLAKHHAQLADEIAQAYINTMRWYYLSHFTRYRLALEKIPLYTIDRHDALADQTNQRGVFYGLKFSVFYFLTGHLRRPLQKRSTDSRRSLAWSTYRNS